MFLAIAGGGGDDSDAGRDGPQEPVCRHHEDVSAILNCFRLVEKVSSVMKRSAAILKRCCHSIVQKFLRYRETDYRKPENMKTADAAFKFLQTCAR